MDIVLNFKEHLMTGTNPCSPVTAKNYIADVRNFIEWSEKHSNSSFTPESISLATIDEYKKDMKTLSASTLERHISSLRKFFHFLSTTQNTANPFTQATINKTELDPWNLKSFKNFLFRNSASNLTIKNYTIDIVQFFKWLSEVSAVNTTYELEYKNIYKYINQDTVEEYKFRLQTIAKLSPSSINRKLSSLRRYVAWAVEEGLLDGKSLTSLQNVQTGNEVAFNLESEQPQNISLDINTEQAQIDIIPDVLEETQKTYSSFPPIRLAQKIKDAAIWGIDSAIASPLSSLIDSIEYTKWSITGKNIFTVSKVAPVATKAKSRKKITDPLAFLTPNFKRSFYAPLSISLKWLPTHKRILHHLQHTRPKWYRIYHSYAFVHYMHLCLLILAVSLSGYIAYDNIKGSKENFKSVLAGSDFTRILNYKGRLTDSKGNPITNPTSVKFALYTDPKNKNSDLIWQEIHNITPDKNGNFIISLGQLSPLSQSIFLQNEKVYLGIKIGDSPELMPRQQIPTSSYATNTDVVQGLRPITDPAAGEKNALLALDSLGNLTIGGTANPIFQATGGIFAISGQTLLLGTNPGTNTDVVIAPDGIGKIDLQKPIQNSIEDLTKGALSGAVSVEDNLAITATSSGQSALYINQNGNGPLISAVSGTTARFVLEYGGNMGIGTTGPVESLLQVADGNDGFGGTIMAKDGGAILMASNGTPPLIIGNNTDGRGEVNLRIFPTGEIDYNNSKTAEPKITLPTDKPLFISGGKGVTIAGQIIPATDGTYNLGSDSLKWNKIYVNEIITSGANGTFGFMQLKEGIVSPSNISNDFTVGGNSTSSAKFHISGSGPTAGSVTSNGTLSFSGSTPKLIIKTNNRFDIDTLGPAEAAPSPKFSILSSGNIGIGTTTPLYRLEVTDSQSNSYISSITNNSTSANAGALSLKIGNPTPDITNTYIAFINGNGQTIGSITGISSGNIVYNTTGSDFAEYFKKTNPYEVLLPGEIVCLGTTGSVSKCGGTSSNIIGVVSGQAGFVGNSRHQNDPNYILVGLIGQIPVTFSRTNGDITPGDPITIDKDGKATKAISTGQIIGKALESSTDSSDGKINVYLSLSWYDPTVKLTSTGTLNTPTNNSIDNTSSSSSILQLDLYIVKGKSFIAESIETSAITAADITTNSLTVAGKSLNEYILEKIAENLASINSQEITSGVASINSIRADVISPLSYDSEIALNFRKQVLEIQNSKTRKIVARIDQEGNAEFAGKITAQNASIAGTLRTGRLEADDIELSEKALTRLKEKTSASPSATYISNITNVYQSTPSATKTNEQVLATNSTPQVTDSLGYIPVSSLSGQLAYVPELKSKFATFEQGLMSFGPTSTSDIAVAGQLSINGSLILADNSINVLGQDLELQPLRQGNLSIMSGRVKIDTDGNMEVAGNANFAKNLKVKDTLFTRIISSFEDSELIVKLNKSKETDKPTFVIQNSSGSARFSVNDLGEVVASGAGRFKEVLTGNINVVRSAQADTSLTETVATASAGTATISKFQQERTILSPYVKKDSLIYITPISDTGGLTPYIARQVVENEKEDIRGSFTIQIAKPTTKDIKVNWWIIN